MALLLAIDPAGLDFAIARAFYVTGSGFIGRHSFWLEDILHDRAKQVVIALGVVAIALFLISLVSRRLCSSRRHLGYLVLSLVLSTSVVTPLKALTACTAHGAFPSLAAPSNSAPCSKSARRRKPGRCWPGGHASAGFSLLALFFFLRDRRPRAARIALAIALGTGTVFSAGRMMQGAHFLSHNLWTLLIDWTICLSCYRWILYRRAIDDENSWAIQSGKSVQET
jgi:PAP2 (acid phosphatase) superfamily protein